MCLWQACGFLQDLERFLYHQNLKDGVPLVITGDFNSVPQSAVYDLLESGMIDPRHPDFPPAGQTGKDAAAAKAASNRNPYAKPAAPRPASGTSGGTVRVTVRTRCVSHAHELFKLRTARLTSTLATGPVRSVGPFQGPAWCSAAQVDAFGSFVVLIVADEVTLRFACSLDLSSAYKQVLGGAEPVYTHFAADFKGTLDYHWYTSQSLRAAAVLEPVSIEAVAASNSQKDQYQVHD
jgi:hypothetical protein